MSRYSVFHSFQDYQNIVEHSPTGMPVELCLRIRCLAFREKVRLVSLFADPLDFIPEYPHDPLVVLQKFLRVALFCFLLCVEPVHVDHR